MIQRQATGILKTNKEISDNLQNFETAQREVENAIIGLYNAPQYVAKTTDSPETMVENFTNQFQLQALIKLIDQSPNLFDLLPQGSKDIDPLPQGTKNIDPLPALYTYASEAERLKMVKNNVESYSFHLQTNMGALKGISIKELTTTLKPSDPEFLKKYERIQQVISNYEQATASSQLRLSEIVKSIDGLRKGKQEQFGDDIAESLVKGKKAIEELQKTFEQLFTQFRESKQAAREKFLSNLNINIKQPSSDEQKLIAAIDRLIKTIDSALCRLQGDLIDRLAQYEEAIRLNKIADSYCYDPKNPPKNNFKEEAKNLAKLADIYTNDRYVPSFGEQMAELVKKTYQSAKQYVEENASTYAEGLKLHKKEMLRQEEVRRKEMLRQEEERRRARQEELKHEQEQKRQAQREAFKAVATQLIQKLVSCLTTEIKSFGNSDAPALISKQHKKNAFLKMKEGIDQGKPMDQIVEELSTAERKAITAKTYLMSTHGTRSSKLVQKLKELEHAPESQLKALQLTLGQGQGSTFEVLSGALDKIRNSFN